MIENRPKVWSDVIFRPIPHQEGEVGIDVSDKKNEEYKPIFDPLGLAYNIKYYNIILISLYHNIKYYNITIISLYHNITIISL
jgi:hypothetical protein